MGNICFLISIYFQFPKNWGQSLELALFIVGIFSYEFVILTLITHYIAKINDRISREWSKNPSKVYFSITFLLGITYLGIDTIIERSLLIFLEI